VCALTNEQEDAATVIHALKVMVDRAGKLVFGEAIQLHGGMGITDDLDIGHYAKRLMMINTTFGNGDYHQAQFNALRYN
jgi:alkylation response protein AidB-like acyl-CoA dehydrogenase